jgi:plastocyanin
MFKAFLRYWFIAIPLLTVVMAGLIAGNTIWASHLRNNNPTSIQTRIHPATSIITLPRGQELFIPFLLVVQLHATVTWKNADTTAHKVTTTAQQSRFLNRQAFSFDLPPGRQQHFTFNQAGLYHYYDPTRSTWNPTLARVAANKGVPHFPLAMDGIIWVEGAIPSLPSVALNFIPKGHDDFASEFLAISRPGGVTWHNLDEDPHFVGLVAGWPSPLNPVDIGLFRIAGTDDIPGGASITVLFTTPGLYYYYCRNHDQVDPFTHRAKALPMASDYPIPMEGFILVVG